MKNEELGEVEYHPYEEFIPEGAHSMIIGSFPIGKFTNPSRRNEINIETEIDFYYGGSKNKLWELIGTCFNRELKSKKAVIDFLNEENIAVADVIKSCRRVKGSALDKDLKEIGWNLELKKLINEKSIKRLLFTSKLVKTWFEKHIGELEKADFVILPSPSPASMISLARTHEFKKWLDTHPGKRPSDYRQWLYRQIFNCK